MEKVYIRDYSRKQIAVLITECFYIIGKKAEELDNFQLETMINGIIKYQGSMQYDDFKEAFSEFAAGNLDVKIFGGPSPIMVGSLIKAYKEKKFGPRTLEARNILPNNDNELKWRVFLKFIKNYGIIPEGSDWISLWNYLLSRNLLVSADASKQLTPILEWNHTRYQLAEKEVKEFVCLNYENYLHDNNVFKGEAGPGNLNIGTRLRQTLGV